MSSARRQACLLSMICALLLPGCGDRPASFSEIDLEEARRLAKHATLVEIVTSEVASASPSGIAVVWHIEEEDELAPPNLPDEPILIVAPSAHVGYRCAAALARRGNLGVQLVIVGDAEDRHTLYAHAREREEALHGTDS